MNGKFTHIVKRYYGYAQKRENKNVHINSFLLEKCVKFFENGWNFVIKAVEIVGIL